MHRASDRELWWEEAPGRLGLSLRLYLAMARLPCKSPRKSPKRSCDPSGGSHPFCPSRPALCGSVSLRPEAAKAEAPPAQPVVPPGEPTPHSQRTSSRPQGSRGIGLPGESARGEQGLGAVEAAPKRWLRRISAQHRAGKVERARATPSRVWEEVRCREQAGERDSLPGPFLLLPSLGQVAFSAPSTSWAQAAGVAPTPATPLQVPPTQGKGTGLAGSLPRH